MAVLEPTLIRAASVNVPPLFDRLPGTIFKPLASLNHERFWAVLAGLHRTRFGPDAPRRGTPSQVTASRSATSLQISSVSSMTAWPGRTKRVAVLADVIKAASTVLTLLFSSVSATGGNSVAENEIII